VQVDFDPAQVTYEELLDSFFGFHNICLPAWSNQYKGAIFAHSAEQQRLAETKLKQQASEQGSPAETEVLVAGTFYLAEDYHQKYYLTNVPDFLKELTAIYPDINDFVNSTAVARVNGYVGRNGSIENLEREIESYGLSPAAKQRLLAMAASENN